MIEKDNHEGRGEGAGTEFTQTVHLQILVKRTSNYVYETEGGFLMIRLCDSLCSIIERIVDISLVGELVVLSRTDGFVFRYGSTKR